MHRSLPQLWGLLLVLHSAAAAAAAASGAQQPLTSAASNTYAPSTESARENANLLFNAIHSSMRQWGSSIQHNGMSIFPATIPNGTLLYHGSKGIEIPPTREWMAFEIEHAEAFAMNVISKPRVLIPGLEEEEEEEDHRMRGLDGIFDATEEDGSQKPRLQPGHLQIYQANRDMKVLYIDGMSAGNSPTGQLDSQDLLLLDYPREPMRDFQRALDLCNHREIWGVEAFIRMEAGFEVIKCNFSEGMDYLSHRKRPPFESSVSFKPQNLLFEYLRDVATRYDGITSGRVILDYSSMISAYFYPANFSNANSDSADYDTSLPRLVNTERVQLQRMRSDLDLVLAHTERGSSIDWQGVVDMVVTRYASRLQYIVSDLMNKETLAYEVNNLLNLYIEYDEKGSLTSMNESMVNLCASHYLRPVTPITWQDRLIYEAIETVSRRICTTLFEIRQDFVIVRDETKYAQAIDRVRDLMEWLRWPAWKSCGTCRADEICYVASWPWGNVEDHYNPSCKNFSQIGASRTGDYWFPELRHDA